MKTTSQNPKINRSAIFRRMWELVRTGMGKSTALKQAWAEAKTPKPALEIEDITLYNDKPGRFAMTFKQWEFIHDLACKIEDKTGVWPLQGLLQDRSTSWILKRVDKSVASTVIETLKSGKGVRLAY